MTDETPEARRQRLTSAYLEDLVPLKELAAREGTYPEKLRWDLAGWGITLRGRGEARSAAHQRKQRLAANSPRAARY